MNTIEPSTSTPTVRRPVMPAYFLGRRGNVYVARFGRRTERPLPPAA